MNAMCLHIADDVEAGSAFALYLAAAGYEVETDFVDGSVFISAEGYEPEVEIGDVKQLACELRCRLDDMPVEPEFAAMRSDFRFPAA
jgi:hypothetical protein